VKFDNKITFGNLITSVSIIFGVAMFYTSLKADVNYLEVNVQKQDIRLALLGEEIQELAWVYKELQHHLEYQSAILGKIADKLGVEYVEMKQ